MKVQFDHQTFSLQQYGGISRYFSVLQDYIQNRNGMSIGRGILVSRNHYLPNNAYPILPQLGRALVSKSRMYAFNQHYSKLLVKKNQFDVFHPTYYDAYFLPWLKKPFVLTVHDMTHEIFPEFFPQNDPFISHKRMLIQKADHIIAISASTRNDLQRIFDVHDDKITVIPHGYYESVTTTFGETIGLPENYLLFVGERSGYKNFMRFITAVSPVLHHHPELKIICAGGGGLTLAETELFYRNKIEGRVIQLQADEPRLKRLYQKALLFVYPSLHEGFGLPILEAFGNRCPVAISRSSSFPEVAGEAAVYFDPYNSEDIKNAIETIINDEDCRERLIQKGAERLNEFSSRKTMESTLAVYDKFG